MAIDKPVGRAQGPGDNTSEFKFITPDKDRVKIGEFVYFMYKESVKNEQKVLSRVINRIPLRLYPNVMLSDPMLDPSQIASTIDYCNDDMEYYLISAQIIGYYKDTMFKFVNPRIPPKPGQPIFLAEANDLAGWINSYKPDETYGAFVGNLLTRLNEDIPIVLDVNKIINTHLAVLAATGTGKSYAVGVLLEELMKAKNKAAVLVFDPHDEYKTLKEIETKVDFKDGDYQPIVEIKKSTDVHIKFNHLQFDEIISLFKYKTDKMESVLHDAFDAVSSTNPNYTLQDIKNQLTKMKNSGNESTINAVWWRLDQYIGNREIISGTHHNYLRDLLTPGKITILNLSSMREDDQQLTTTVLLDRILKQRVRWERSSDQDKKSGKLDPTNDQDILDFPVFIVVEEGHRFAPANRESWSKDILKTIMSEGRKFGVGICIISQRPGKLDSDVLSQCMTQIILKIINPVDQKNIKESVESVSEDLIRELPGLTKGQALIAGEGINTPVLVRIRTRLTRHGGENPNAVKIWREYKPPKPKLYKVDNANTRLD